MRWLGQRLVALAIVVISVALSACGFLTGWTPTPVVSAREVLARSASAMDDLTSAHFRFIVSNGTMALGPGLEATSFEGDAAAPDRLNVLIRARLSGTPVELRLIAIGDRQYLTNPLSRQWQDVSGSLNTPALLDSRRGIGLILRSIEEADFATPPVPLGGSPFHIRGTIRANAIASLVGGGDPASGVVSAELRITQGDYRLRSARLVGAISQGEAASLERLLELSEFNRPVTIEPPSI